MITEQSGSDLKKMSDFLKSIKGVFCAPSMTNVMDLTSEGVSKGSAVKILADYLGINRCAMYRELGNLKEEKQISINKKVISLYFYF